MVLTDSTASVVPREYLALLREELSMIGVESAREAAVIARAATLAPELNDASAVYGGQIERMRETCELIGLMGLARLCSTLLGHLTTAVALEPDRRAPLLEFLWQWPMEFSEYLIDPTDRARCAAIHGYVGALIGGTATIDIAALLVEVASAHEPGGAFANEPVPQAATEVDVVLSFAADLDDTVREAFAHESQEHAERIVVLTERLTVGLANADERRALQRYAHSLKGSANIVGARGVANLAHPLEDLFEAWNARALTEPNTATPALDPRLARFLRDAAMTLASAVGAVLGLETRPPELAQTMTQARQLAYAARRGMLDEALAPLPATAAPISSSAPVANALVPSAALRGAVGGADQTVADAPPTAPRSDALRVPVATVDSIFRLLGETGAMALRSRGELASAHTELRSLRERLIDVVETDSIDAARALLIEAASEAQHLENRLRELAGRATDQERLNRELGRLTLSTRMLPIATLAPRLARAVKQTCQRLGKEARFVVVGEDILVDGDLLEALGDPLMHILRNAIDHGIESTAVREQRGKSAQGTIELVVTRRGPVVTVTVRDDGAGLDYDRIRSHALERGLIDIGAQLSRTQLAQLVLSPGFTTKDAVTDVSGRGVGMDVVAERLRAMNGQVLVESEPGAGCTIALRFQATLVSQHALVIAEGDDTFAVPSHHVEAALAPNMAGFVIASGLPAVAYRGRTLPLYSLGNLVASPAASMLSGPESPDTVIGPEFVRQRALLIVLVDDAAVAVGCARLLDARELIVKSTGRLLKRLPGLAGAVVLPNGAIAAVIDLPHLVRLMRDRMPLVSQSELLI